MKNRRKIALFDFCETLVNFQTADAYVKYVLLKKNLRGNIFQKILETSKISAILFRLGLNVNKRLLLYGLKGLSKSELDNLAMDYYKDRILPNLIKESVTLIPKLKSEGYEIIIVSGGYDIYLKYFSDEFGVDRLICTSLDFVDNFFTGNIKGKDCMGVVKVQELTKLTGKKNLKDCESISFSDSYSDKPLLDYSRKAVVVCKKAPKWAVNNNYNILLWQ